MMQLEESLVAFLRSDTEIVDLVENRIFPKAKPQDELQPCITYINVYSEHVDSLNGGSGLLRARIEVVCWGTYKKAKELSEVVRKKMQGYQGVWGDRTIQGCRYIEHNDYDMDEAMVRLGQDAIGMDFEVWTDESQDNYYT